MAIPFKIPSDYASDLASGALTRSGALLKDSSSGQIVAHLQETGMGQQLIHNMVSSPFSPIEAISIPSSIAANFQLLQLKKMVELLQVLQITSLAATVSGIGVSAIGFVLMNKKLNILQAQITDLESRVEDWFKVMHERELRAHYSRLHGLFNEANQAYAMSNPAAEFLRIAPELAKESAFYCGEIAFLVQEEVFDIELFKALTQSYALCNAGRIECLLNARELNAAFKISSDVAFQYNTLFDSLNPIQLAHKSPVFLENTKTPSDHVLRQELCAMEKLVGYVREIQDVAMSKPYLLKTLIDRGVDAHEYVQTIRMENEQLILLIEAS